MQIISYINQEVSSFASTSLIFSMERVQEKHISFNQGMFAQAYFPKYHMILDKNTSRGHHELQYHVLLQKDKFEQTGANMPTDLEKGSS